MMDVERLYLETRYSCEALRIRYKRSGNEKLSVGLKEAMSLLCSELRAILAKEGKDKVSVPFPVSLLELDTNQLYRKCVESAKQLYMVQNSMAAEKILELLGS